MNHSKNSKYIKQFMNKHNKCNIIESILPPVKKIVAIGDIHGDFSVLIESLKVSEVINDNLQWIAGGTYVVQVGDVFDGGGRGLHRATGEIEEIKILEFLYDLHQQAIKKGGKVISLIGNHELMNILGDFRYASKEQIDGLGGYQQRKEFLKPGGVLAKKLACNSLGIVKIGDWVFVHGGLLPEHFDTNNTKETKDTIYDINHLVRGIMLGDIQLSDITPHEENIIFGGNGIFWTRKLSGKFPNDNDFSQYHSDNRCQLVDQTLRLLNVKNGKGGIVMGHTPQPYINSLCNQRIWRIDTGMSRAFGDKLNDKERVQTLIIYENGKHFDIK